MFIILLIMYLMIIVLQHDLDLVIRLPTNS
jgi:hypothetical protein